MSALFSAADYTAALAGLRPRGRVWPTDPNSGQLQLLASVAPSLERTDAAAQALLVDAFPATAVNLLTEWEESLGLPDPCVGPGATLAQSQAQVVARLTLGGGQSAQRYIGYAASLGFQISIKTYAPFRAGQDRCGEPLYGPQWVFAWSVSVQASEQGFSDAVLLCELQTLKPAETVVFLSA